MAAASPIPPRTVWSPMSAAYGASGVVKRALLIHGLTSAGPTWLRVAEGLAAHGYEVIAPDFYGHGLCASPSSPSEYALPAVAAALRPLLDPRPDLIIGHSMGCILALMLLPELLPDLPVVYKLPGDHIGPKFQVGNEKFQLRVVLLDPGFDIPQSAMESIAKSCLDEIDNTPSVDEYLADPANTGWSRRDAITRVAAISMCKKDAVVELVKQNNPWNFFSVLPPRHSSLSVLILASDPAHGAIFTPEDIERVRETHKHVQVRTAAGCGHGIHRQNPAIVLEESLGI